MLRQVITTLKPIMSCIASCRLARTAEYMAISSWRLDQFNEYAIHSQFALSLNISLLIILHALQFLSAVLEVRGLSCIVLFCVGRNK